MVETKHECEAKPEPLQTEEIQLDMNLEEVKHKSTEKGVIKNSSSQKSLVESINDRCPSIQILSHEKESPEEKINELFEENKNVLKKTLEKVRDLFCLGCFTGQRWSDISNIDINQIHETNWVFYAKKTNKIKILNLICFNMFVCSLFYKIFCALNKN